MMQCSFASGWVCLCGQVDSEEYSSEKEKKISYLGNYNKPQHANISVLGTELISLGTFRHTGVADKTWNNSDLFLSLSTIPSSVSTPQKWKFFCPFTEFHFYGYSFQQ